MPGLQQAVRRAAAEAGPAPARTAAATTAIRALRDTFGRLPSGVCVITTDGERGPHGMTASSVCSLSLDPPLLLVWIDNRSVTLQAVATHGGFAVNVLAADQGATSALFASSSAHPERFSRTAHRHVGRSPVLDGAAAWLLCDVHDFLTGGDHTIVVGRVLDAGRDAQDPLVWHGGRYRRLSAAA